MNKADKEKKEAWHSLTIEEVLEQLETTTEGHSQSEAMRRQKYLGSNILERTRPSALRLFLNQLNRFLIIFLLLIVLLSSFM